MNCAHFGICGGCPTGGVPYSQQLIEKAQPVTAALGISPAILSVGEGELRDRAEMVWKVDENGPAVGFFKKDLREVLHLKNCPMFTPALNAWLAEFVQKVPPISLGTVRLRVSPSGQRGAWLDFANVDVKTLFDEREYLKWLSDRAIVEIGQRRKRFVWKDGQPKLIDPVLFPWFETYGRDSRAIPLYGVVGGFTQVGFRANRALVDKVVSLARKAEVKEWVELFCGSGNFSLALADNDFSVSAYENDDLGVQALERSIGELGLKNLNVNRVDVYHHPHKIASLAGKGLLLDPPRSGLGKLLAWLEAMALADRPQNILYVSCFTDSFTSDVQKLRDLGYSTAQVDGVDQFPHSGHMEWVSLLSKAK